MELKTGNIRLFLREFTDQQLANFQAACEDGKIEFMDGCNCIIGFRCDNDFAAYRAMKYPIDETSLVRRAETEFCRLASNAPSNQRDAARAIRTLPLIADEWTRRRTSTQPTEETNIHANANIVA